MKTPTTSAAPRLTALAIGITLTALSHAQTTGWNKTAGGTYDYNDTANWVDSTINGIWDASLTLTGAQTIQFSADTILTTSLDFQAFGNQNILLQGTGGARTITLGGDITSNISVNKALTIGSGTTANNLNVDLGGVTRTFTAGSSKSLTFRNVISNGAVSTYGGTVIYEGINTYSGTTTVNTGILALNGSVGSAANSDFTVIANGSNVTNLQFNSNTSGNTGTTRAKSVTLNGSTGSGGATLSVTGNATANSVDVIDNALTASAGYGIVSISPNAARNARLEAGSFVRNAGSSILFRGTDLGVSTIASQTAGDANIKFDITPDLVGGAGAADSTTVSILKGAYGEITTGGTGSTGGLVTYDSTYGVRRLNTATEYTTAIANGQTQLDNVLYSRSSGGASQDTHLTATTTTINSLSFGITGTGTNSGVTISGDAGTTLEIDSGTIFANQTVTTPVATDKILISVPKIDLNGGEGIIITGATNGQSGANNNINAPLQIDSEITNDGGLGLTKGGGGHLRIGGTVQSTYTGNTVLNAGVLYLDKSVTNIALPASNTLVINGGTVYQTNNQLPDSTNVIINGGGWTISGSSSNGNSSAESFNNLTMTGGSFRNGASNGGTTNILGFANLSGGTFTAVGSGSNVTVTGAMTISNGATVSVGASGNSSGNSRLTLNGGLAITNTATGAYTPITLSASSTAANLGGRLILGGDVTFTGNGTNANTTTIDATTNTGPRGTLELNATRTFNIGNGAAATDLAINATVINGTATSGLTKTGSGTLELAAANTYSGATTVSAGTLLVSGSIASSAATIQTGATLALASGTAGSVTIDSGAFLAGSGTVGNTTVNGTLAIGNSPGTLTLSDGATLTLGSGSVSNFEFTSSGFGLGTYDLVAGTAGGSPESVIFNGTLNLAFTGTGYTAGTDVVRIFDLTSLSGSFTSINVTGLDTFGLTAEFNATTGYISLVTSTVPEPSTFALLGGAASLLLANFRRRRTAL